MKKKINNISRLYSFRNLINKYSSLEEGSIKKPLIKILALQKKAKTTSKLIDLNDVKDWYQDRGGNFYHKSNQFFYIKGVRTTSAYNREVKQWDQPILDQPHGGILAIISRLSKKKGVQFLLRVRVEPGDCGKMKFCPTFQATISNINKAHGGKLPDFYEEVINFKNTELIWKASHNEEGGRFWKKVNQNMLLFTNSKIDFSKRTNDSCWLSMKQIKKLSLKNNLINPFVKTILFMI